MDIMWHGRNCFTIKGKNATVVTDPLDGTGFNTPKLRADIVLLTENSEGLKLIPVEGEPITFDMPGEYEVGGIPVTGVQSWESEEAGKKITFFIFEVDGVRICHLGNLNEKISSEMSEKIGEVDVLLLPVGGGEVLDHKIAHNVIEEIEPRIVIPMSFQANGEKEKFADIEPFLKEVGAKGMEEERFSASGRTSLPQDRTEFHILKPV